MLDPMRKQIAPYLDGALQGRSRLELEAHLAICPDCQQELEALRDLSRQLQTLPAPEFMPPSRFSTQLLLQLPRRETLPHQPAHPSRRLAWLAPAAILSAWLFLQITLGLSSLVSLAQRTGILGGAVDVPASDAPQAIWFQLAQSALGGLTGMQGQAALPGVEMAGAFVQSLSTAIFWQVLLAGVYWAWLAYWLRQRAVFTGEAQAA